MTQEDWLKLATPTSIALHAAADPVDAEEMFPELDT